MFVVPPPAVDGLGNAAASSCRCRTARPRRAGAVRRGLGNARPGLHEPEVEHRHAVFDLRHQRAAALRQRRPRARQADGRGARRHLRHDAGQPRLALRQRLQQVRQDLPGRRPGGRAVSRRRRGDHGAEDAQQRRRDGAARRADEGRADVRPDARDALQRLPVGRHQRRARSRLSRPGRPSRDRVAAQAHAGARPVYEWTELTYQDRLTRDVTCPGRASRCRCSPR
jgi:hypothetical protein